MLHRFATDISHIEPPKRFTYPFCYTPHPLCVAAAEEVRCYLARHQEWKEELAGGKMMGVLVVEDERGELGFLAAFSGLLAGENRHEWFVPPIYDLLNPGGYFRTEEANISQINRLISRMETSEELVEARKSVESEKSSAAEAISAHKRVMTESKRQRDVLRAEKDTDEQALIRQSQWQRAELRRIRAYWESRISSAGRKVEDIESRIMSIKRERAERSAQLQRWLFDRYEVFNAHGEKCTLSEIFAATPQRVPPGGAGECAAPKLLQYAYLNDLRPVAIAEFWCGKSPLGELRYDGHYYPACRSKCYPILTFMLQGLDVDPDPTKTEANSGCDGVKILYEDRFIVAAEKPAGMLTVPGKISSDSLYSRLRSILVDVDELMVVHRLDQATSGVVLFAKNRITHKALQRQFSEHSVAKKYVALVEQLGGIPLEGEINLPICPDYHHRPQQKVCYREGRSSRTLFRVLGAADAGGIDAVRVEFQPLTGRTHQIRLHAAHSDGLGSPVVGDRLYGRVRAERMYLHAESLTFIHPADGRALTVTSPCPF